MDNVSKKKRSEIMAKIRGKDTGPERIMWDLLQELQELPERWANLPGKPDFVFERSGVVVFVDGCFWHRCPTCNPNIPSSNVAFWANKFMANVERDKKVTKLLTENGWHVMRIWECEVKHDPDDVLYRIEMAILTRLEELKDALGHDRI